MMMVVDMEMEMEDRENLVDIMKEEEDRQMG